MQMFGFLSRSGKENDENDDTNSNNLSNASNFQPEETSEKMPGTDDQISELAKQIESLKSQLEESMQRGAGSQSGSAVNAVTEVKLVPFYENDPDLWFKIIEATFEARKITSERSRYFHVVSQLSSTVAQQIKDVISSAYSEGKYDELKKSLTTIYAETATEKFEKLISSEPLGDMKPSSALHKIKGLASDTVKEDFIKKLWLKRLPQTIKAVLSASSDPLDNLAKMADSMWEVSDKGSISSISQGNSLEKTFKSFQQQLENITKRLNAMDSQNRSSRRDTTPHRERSHSRNNKRNEREGDNDSDVCWYHRKMGEQAKKCRSPCAFKSSNQKN